MNTIEGNRLIAEFMGWRLNIVNRPNSVIQDRIEKEYHVISPDGRLVQSCSTTFHGTELETKDNILKHLLADYGWWGKYHTSWDWLMPVYRKIAEIGLFMMTNGYDKLWLEKSKEIEYAVLHEETPHKAATLIAQLIIWFNKNNPQ